MTVGLAGGASARTRLAQAAAATARRRGQQQVQPADQLNQGWPLSGPGTGLGPRPSER